MKSSHAVILALVVLPASLAAQAPAANPVTTVFRTRITGLQRNLAQAFDSLQVLIEPFEDRFHGFICPLPIHVEVYAVF